MKKIETELIKPIYLGGTGEMYLTIIDGKEYLFKPAISKYEHDLEPFRADIQEVGYNVQKLVDDKSSVYCFTGTTKIDDEDVYGAFQEYISTIPFDIKKWQYSNSKTKLDINISNSILRESVTDYLLCNMDAHGGNYIKGKDKIIRGIDKEQSLRYIKECDYHIDLNYSPNQRYGEAEPIINTVLKRYSLDKCDIYILSVYDYISKVEAIDDYEYLDLYSKYISSLSKQFHQSNREQNQIKDLILTRKQRIREAYTDILLNVLETRKNNVSLINETEELINKVKTKKLI